MSEKPTYEELRKQVQALKKAQTALKKTEAALRDSEEKYRKTFESITDSITVTRVTDGLYLYVNDGFCHQTGYSRKEVLGKTPSHLNTKKIPVFDENGQPIYLLGISEDITVFKQLEEQIRQTQKMESIGNLAGGIAHDFNNILFPIVGMSELLLEDLPHDSLEHENVQQILKAGERGRDLVQQILAFSRQSEHKKIPVRVQQVLEEVLNLSRSIIPANIEIYAEIQYDCGLIMGDATQIHQIAMNLITNAYHAAEQTGGNISVYLKQTTIEAEELPPVSLEPGQYAMLTVSDTGCGIDPDHVERIFDPYFTTKEKGKGTGLGLAVVYGIIREHGGNINVDSELGKGSTFQVYLPLIRKPAKGEPVKDVKPGPTGRERIMLVDDEETIVQLEKQILERLGYQVNAFTGSLDALGVFKRDPDAFDLVMTDMTMPKMTGDRLAEELMSIRQDIPIIICTGFSERINKEKAAVIGVKGFLMKPVRKVDMANLLREILDEAKAPTQE